MRRALLVLTAPLVATAALTLPATPSSAQSSASADFTAVRGALPTGALGTASPPPPFFDHVFPGDRHDGDGPPNSSVVFGGGWYGGDWALYNNRGFEPDSYNGWWHEEPWRAYPAWMRRNQNCDRKWWSGDTLVC